MNLWMVYTCNLKSSGKYKRLKEGECNQCGCEICGFTRPFKEI